MKTILILTGSIILNVAFAVAYLLKPMATPSLAKPQEEAVSSSGSANCVVEKSITNMVTVTKPAKAFDWHKVESEDYKQYVANLRAIGCPEKTLRDIIMADVTDLFRQRVRNSSSNRFEYWKPGLLGNAFDEKRVAMQNEQAKERREILTTLLGESYSDKADPAGGQIVSPMEQMTEDILSPEKQVAMKAFEVKYAARMLKAAKEEAGGDGEAMRKVMAEKDAEILTLLSPEEKFEYDLRLSQPAILLRLNMGEFEPTEEEFREMYKTAKKFTDRFGLQVITGLADVRQANGEGNEMLDGLKAVLGDQRFQQFQNRRVLASAQR
jgi:hypothetical protein